MAFMSFTVIHDQVFEHSDTVSFTLLACIILYINGKHFRCSVFTFVQYILDHTVWHSDDITDFFFEKLSTNKKKLIKLPSLQRVKP